MKVCNLPVVVLALYTSNGIPKPLRFWIKNEDEHIVVKNVKVNNIEETRIRGEKKFKYTCQNVIKNKLRLFELRFNTKQCKWHLFKI